MPKEPGVVSVMDSCFTQNGVHLLLVVLPPLRHCTRLLESQLDRSKQDILDFYRYFDVYTRLLLQDLYRLQHSTLSPESEPSANFVLTRLNEVVSEDIRRNYHSMILYSEPSHWKLRLLTEALLSTKLEEPKLAEIRQHIDFGTAEQRNTLVDAIRTYSEDLNLKHPEDFIPKEYSQPQKRWRKDPSYKIGVVASSLYQALSNRMTCTCTEVHDYAARIALATYRGRKDEGQKFDFDLMFCLDFPRSSWKETHVRASLAQPPKRPSRVQSVLDEPDSSKKRTHKGFPPRRQRINEICKPLKEALTSKLTRLNLELEDGDLYKIQSTKTRFTSDELTNVVSLGQLISRGTTSLGEKAKRVLAVLLGYAVLHHYGGSWLGPSWGRDDVIFMKSATAIPLRPYMITRVPRMAQTGPVTSNQEDDLDDVNPDDFPIHPYPDLVTLGTILLEVHTGKPIEDLAAALGIEEHENVNAKWLVAVEVYQKIQRDLPDNYSEAVNACLDSNFGSSASDLDGEQIKEEDFRRLIYTNIVKPVEDELDQGFGKSISINDLDNIAETMDLGSWGQTFQRKVPEQLETPLLTPLQPHSSEVSISSQWPKHGDHEKQLHVPQLPVASDFEVFDDSSGPENSSSKSCQLSDGRMKMIHKTYEYHIPEPDTQQRVRIAALDIGVDPNHPNMGSERIQSVRSWVNGENGKEEDRRASDESGHGTHTTVEEDDDSIMGDLFDSSSATSPSDTAHWTNDWFKELQATHKLLSSNRRHPPSKEDKEKRVKIAILDTGIDLKHPLLKNYIDAGQIPQVHDFVEDRDDIKDTNGHGTHSAHLLLKTAPNAAIYVARVFEKAKANKRTPDLVSEAIKYAVETWKVDIISMSFAFLEEIENIQTAIKNASFKNVLMFAAASNNRHNKENPIGYPARVWDHVICVNSTDGRDNKSAFSPKGEAGRDNFSVVGERVEAAWPMAGIQNGNQKEKEQQRQQNGTSCATPIAAGIAALILEYTIQIESQMGLEITNVKRIRGCRGMSRVMWECMTHKKTDHHYNELKPWFLLKPEHDREKISSKIRDALHNSYTRRP